LNICQLYYSRKKLDLWEDHKATIFIMKRWNLRFTCGSTELYIRARFFLSISKPIFPLDDNKMIGHKFAFYVTLKPNMIKDLKIRCDYKEEFECGGTLEFDEIKMVEGEILRVAGKFGVIDLGISMSELKKIIKKSGEKNE